VGPSLEGPVHCIAGVAEAAAMRRPASLRRGRELELTGEVPVVDRASWVDHVQVLLILPQGMMMQIVPGALMHPGASPGAGCRVPACHDRGRHRGALEGAHHGHCWGPVVVVAATLGSSIPWLS
jgi:hypothetical protein